MKISDFLSPADSLVDFRASDKRQLLRELSQKAASSIGLSAESIASSLSKREGLGSTGLGSGVAIPHARLPDLKRPYGILVRLRKAVEFEAIDGQPVDLVFLLLLPEEKATEQLNVLAMVARGLRNPEVLRGLRSASESTDLYKAMVNFA
jgi:PTS system nitrogen regulatory IIA component